MACLTVLQISVNHPFPVIMLAECLIKEYCSLLNLVVTIIKTLQEDQ